MCQEGGLPRTEYFNISCFKHDVGEHYGSCSEICNSDKFTHKQKCDAYCSCEYSSGYGDWRHINPYIHVDRLEEAKFYTQWQSLYALSQCFFITFLNPTGDQFFELANRSCLLYRDGEKILSIVIMKGAQCSLIKWIYEGFRSKLPPVYPMSNITITISPCYICISFFSDSGIVFLCSLQGKLPE